MRRNAHFFSFFASRLTRLFGGEAGAGILLIVTAIAALGVANSPLADAYHEAFHHALPWSPVAKLATWHAWINDGLMAVFFSAVGLEIKRELVQGELASPARRRLPFLAAAAGMLVPALVYLAVARSEPALFRGWAIASATDIAFAVGVLALLGSRVPRSLRLFLLTVAIVDDLGAVIVIAVAYTAQIDMAWLGAGAGVWAAMVAMNRLRIASGGAYVVLAIVLWFCILHSGVHATVAGVLAAFTVPLRLDRDGDSPLLRLEHSLVPWSAYLIVPLFGFANAGVSLGGGAGDPATLPWAIALGLFAGKPAGILGALKLAQASGFAALPAEASWLQLWGVAVLCGIGFTMSLFIAGLAFPHAPELGESAKLGILGGSLASALLGYAILRLSPATSSRR